MKKISKGTSEYRSDIEEVNKWVSEIKKAYDPVKLKQEVEEINSPISTGGKLLNSFKKGRAQSHPLVGTMWETIRPALMMKGSPPYL